PQKPPELLEELRVTLLEQVGLDDLRDWHGCRTTCLVDPRIRHPGEHLHLELALDVEVEGVHQDASVNQCRLADEPLGVDRRTPLEVFDHTCDIGNPSGLPLGNAVLFLEPLLDGVDHHRAKDREYFLGVSKLTLELGKLISLDQVELDANGLPRRLVPQLLAQLAERSALAETLRRHPQPGLSTPRAHG